MEDIMQACMGMGPQKAYLVDLPRAVKKDKLAGFFGGLESLKNGVMYDKRYAFKKARIDRPQVVVFTNVLPDFSYMSLDRWEVWEMKTDKMVYKMVIEGQALRLASADCTESALGRCRVRPTLFEPSTSQWHNYDNQRLAFASAQVDVEVAEQDAEGTAA
jgi:hypothetical protein